MADLDSNLDSNEFLSLQDICKMKILFDIELFPSESLSLLPSAIRASLTLALPVFDRLHYESSGLSCGDFPFLDDGPSSSDTDDNGMNSVFGGCRNIDTIKGKLIQYLFGCDVSPCLVDGCGLNIQATSLACLFTTNDQLIAKVFNYMKCYCSCKVLTSVRRLNTATSSRVQRIHHYSRYFVVPLRFMTFLTAEEVRGYGHSCFDITVSISNLPMLISYCGLQTKNSPISVLSVDTVDLLGSPVWEQYKVARDVAIIKKRSSKKSPVSTAINPVCPCVQSILQHVERLEIGTDRQINTLPGITNWKQVLSVEVPYFILSNIVSCHKPHLKSIHVHGTPPLIVDVVVTAGAFLCAGEVNSLHTLNHCSHGQYSLVPPNESYYIEKLAVIAESGMNNCVLHCLQERDSAVLSETINKVITYQNHCLQSLSLSGLGFTYKSLDPSCKQLSLAITQARCQMEIVNSDEYRLLLTSTLVEFVSLAQFQSLELGNSPDKECFHLLCAFLTTPTTHKQELNISLENTVPYVSDWCKGYAPLTNLPQSNVLYKSLHLNCLKSPLLDYLFSFPYLALRALRLSTLNLNGIISSQVNIHSIYLEIESDPFDVEKLDIFISRNPSLSSLTLHKLPFNQSPSLFPGLNKCLLRLYNSECQIDDISLIDINLFVKEDEEPSLTSSQLVPAYYHNQHDTTSAEHIHTNTTQSLSVFSAADEQGYDFLQWMWPNPMHQEVDIASYFTSDHRAISIPFNVCNDQDQLYVFFCLVQKLQSTLTISGHRFVSYFEGLSIRNLLRRVASTFSQTNNKITKIILKDRIKEYKEDFAEISAVFESVP